MAPEVLLPPGEFPSGPRRLAGSTVDRKEDTQRTTKSMYVAQADLRLSRLYVVHPGEGVFPLAKGIEAVGLAALPGVLRAEKLSG